MVGRKLGLGLDTGGTYTDAAVVDMSTFEVLAKAKSPTTYHDLSIGILGAIDGVLRSDAFDSTEISFVGLSTTLATNSILTGKGGRVGHIGIGWTPHDGFRSGADLEVYIKGGHGVWAQQQEPLDTEAIASAYLTCAEKLAVHVTDTTLTLHKAIAEGRRILFEGAQGTLLDIDHGTFPYVTSSTCITGGICGGAGVPSSCIRSFIGVVKAYTTRVGSGPFPTELNDDTGETIRRRGHEYGTTTGRPRRCGWFDAVAAQYSTRLSGITHLAVMHLDTLSGLDVPVFCPYTDWHLINPNLDPENENSWALYTVGPGVVHMDGDLALWYARSRKKSSDFDRGRRSQEVLRALYTRALQTNAISKIPQLYNDFSSAVITDLGLEGILKLAPLALHLNNADIRSYYIGRDMVTGWMTPGGASVLLPNAPSIQSMLQQALSSSPRVAEQATLTVEVRNGTANPAWDALAAERLNYAGYNTRLAPADRPDYANSLLYDLATVPDLKRANSLMIILGLPPADFVSAPTQADMNYVLILGADYQPCFNPSGLTP